MRLEKVTQRINKQASEKTKGWEWIFLGGKAKKKRRERETKRIFGISTFVQSEYVFMPPMNDCFRCNLTIHLYVICTCFVQWIRSNDFMFQNFICFFLEQKNHLIDNSHTSIQLDVVNFSDCPWYTHRRSSKFYTHRQLVLLSLRYVYRIGAKWQFVNLMSQSFADSFNGDEDINYKADKVLW